MSGKALSQTSGTPNLADSKPDVEVAQSSNCFVCGLGCGIHAKCDLWLLHSLYKLVTMSSASVELFH